MGVELDRTEQLIRTLVLSVFAWGVIWSTIAVFLRDRLQHRKAWGAWAALVIVASALLTFYVSNSFDNLPTAPFTWFYMAVALISIPSAASLMAAHRTNRKGLNRSFPLRLGRAVLAFVIAFPLGAIVAALPEFIVFMTQ
jgi:hypothetical protein